MKANSALSMLPEQPARLSRTRDNTIKLTLAPLLLSALTFHPVIQAAEGGKSLYLLGKRGPLAGLIPKPGYYVTNDFYYYSGDNNELVPIGDRINQTSRPRR